MATHACRLVLSRLSQPRPCSLVSSLASSPAVIGIIVLIVVGGDRKMKVPFGPFMALGTVVAVFLGQNYVDFVLGR